jgi:hypothetical protein
MAKEKTPEWRPTRATATDESMVSDSNSQPPQINTSTAQPEHRLERREGEATTVVWSSAPAPAGGIAERSRTAPPESALRDKRPKRKATKKHP